jgi:hypothetical protein
MANVDVQHAAAEASANDTSGRPDTVECRKALPAADANGSKDVSTTNASSKANDRVQFVCPAHECWTCTQVDCKQQEQDERQSQQRIKAAGSRRTKGKGKVTSVFDSKSERYLIVRILCPVELFSLIVNLTRLAVLLVALRCQ